MQHNSNLTKTNKLAVFAGIPASFKNALGKTARCVRHIISYADDIVITTNNKLELDNLIEHVKTALKE